MRIKDLLSEEKAAIPPKPRNFVAKNAKMGGAGQHKDKKKAEKQGDAKHKKDLATMESQGVAEGSTTRGGFGGSAGQAQHEIEWLKKKISSLPPTKEKQIRDLQRQIRERELAIAFQKEGVAEGFFGELDTEISDMLGGYIAKYQDGLLDADHLGAMIDKAAAKLAQKYNTDANEMARHVSNHVADAIGEE